MQNIQKSCKTVHISVTQILWLLILSHICLSILSLLHMHPYTRRTYSYIPLFLNHLQVKLYQFVYLKNKHNPPHNSSTAIKIRKLALTQYCVLIRYPVKFPSCLNNVLFRFWIKSSNISSLIWHVFFISSSLKQFLSLFLNWSHSCFIN